MEQKTIRLFVGNLPLDTSEDDVKRIMKKYASVISVDIKNRTDVVFAFVNLTDLKADLETCLNKLALKTWKGHQLRVQIAKESFLQRLARERMNNQTNSTENTNVSAITEKTLDYSVKHLERGTQDNKKINGCSPKENCSSNDVSSDSEDSTYDLEIPRKGDLPMFPGTKAGFQNEKQRFSKPSSKISTNRIHEEKEILGKFEMYNSVWKDEPSDKESNPPKRDLEIKVKKSKKDCSFPVDLNIIEKVSVSPFAESLMGTSLIKQEEAEKRRKKALEDKQKEILKKKRAVKFALASVDDFNCTNRPNKKILFSDDETPLEGNENSSQHKEGKLILFKDDDMECETNFENDFRIRNHFEGEKGQSLLALQAKYNSDNRFILDERFMESDEDEEKGKTDNDDTQEERQKVLKILGTVLGEEVADSGKTKSKYATKLMLRYDPTKPGHEKFEIKQNSNLQKLKNKKDNDVQTSTTSINKGTRREHADELPVVSKERYYQVSEKLQETLQNKDQKFSLLEMFGEENQNEGVNIDSDTKPISKKKNEWTLNPFKDDFGASENEIYEQKYNNTDYDSTQNNVGVRQENLFFSLNDARFIEGLEFINQTNEEYMNNFHEIRNNIKRIIKRKAQKNFNKAEKWKTKIGGRRKITSSRKTLKNNSR